MTKCKVLLFADVVFFTLCNKNELKYDKVSKQFFFKMKNVRKILCI